MDTGSITLIVLALDSHHEPVFQLSLISHVTYTDLLQEAMGLARALLKNEQEIVRVEIHNEVTIKLSPGKPLTVLTTDDVIPKVKHSDFS